MQERFVDALIIGGGPGGLSTAITAKQFWPDKSILLIRREAEPIVPCGIPYIFGTLKDVDKDLVSTAPFTSIGGEIIIGTIVAINREQKTATTKEGLLIHWQKLVLATGTEPFIPPIPGAEYKNVFVVHKNHDYLENLFDDIFPAIKKLVIIGGGFIGVEFADQAVKQGIEVTIIERLPHILMRNFDPEICQRVETRLKQMGIKLKTNAPVKAFLGDENHQVHSVLLENEEVLEAQAVLVAIGDRRNIQLAQTINLTIARGGGIWVDAFQRSREDHSVFAVGDCAFKEDFFLRRSIPSLLASNAAAEGRVAGMNLFELQQPRYNTGSIAIYASQIEDLAFGCAGMTATAAEQEDMPVIIGKASVPDHHPPTMPGTKIMDCHLIFSLQGHLLGGQVIGGNTTAEVLNAIGIAIQAKIVVSDLVTFQFGSHPRLTAPAHPIVLAASDALLKFKKL